MKCQAVRRGRPACLFKRDGHERPPTILFRNLPVRRVGDPFPLSAPSPGDHFGYLLEALAGGGFVTTWSNYPNAGRAQRFDAGGA